VIEFKESWNILRSFLTKNELYVTSQEEY